MPTDGFHLTPFVVPDAARRPGAFPLRGGSSRGAPLRLFVRGAPYRLLGVCPDGPPPVRRRSARTASTCSAPIRPGATCCRGCCYGSQISLTVGLVGHRDLVHARAAARRHLGLLRRLDRHRHHAHRPSCCSAFPALYLIIALRGVFPIDLPSQQVYLGIVAILAFIGWAGLARVIRGMVLSIRAPGVRRRRRGAGHEPAAHHRAPHPAQHDVVRDRRRDDRGPRLHPGRGRAVVPRRRRAGAERVVGQHAEPGAQHPRADVVPVAAVRARDRDLPDRDGVQLPRRRAARRARSAQGAREGDERDERAAAARSRTCKTHFFTDDGVVRAVDGVSYDVRAGRDARGGRRVGQRQERDRALDPAADRRAAGQHRRRAASCSRAANLLDAADGRDARDPRQGDLDDLPGADDVAEPGLHLRRADHRDAACCTRSWTARAARARAIEMLQLRRHPVARAARRRVPAPDVGRHAPARHDRDGARVPAGDPDRRRADHRARRHDPGADPRAAQAPAARARHGGASSSRTTSASSPRPPTASP